MMMMMKTSELTGERSEKKTEKIFSNNNFTTKNEKRGKDTKSVHSRGPFCIPKVKKKDTEMKIMICKVAQVLFICCRSI